MRSPALRVAAPCPLRWEEMAGDDRVRFCGQCQQHVYNVESLSPGEVRALVERREGRVCVRLQRRSDGTVITRDCWYAVRRARERLVATGIGLVAAAAGFWGSVGVLRRLVLGLREPAPLCDTSTLLPRADLPALPEPPVEQPASRHRPRPRIHRPVKVETHTMGVMVKID